MPMSRWRHPAFLLCLLILGFGSAIQQVDWIFSALLERPMPDFLVLHLGFQFGSLVPMAYAGLFPRAALYVLSLVLLLLVLRRIWRLGTTGRLPSSFRGLPQLLAYVGLAATACWLALLLAPPLSSSGLPTPAGILRVTATFCIPWAVFLTELQDFFQPAPAGSKARRSPGVLAGPESARGR
jgi:hypothetical protein